MIECCDNLTTCVVLKDDLSKISFTITFIYSYLTVGINMFFLFEQGFIQADQSSAIDPVAL